MITKIVATSDTHFPFDAGKIPYGDIFIHAGDLMYSGLPDEWYPVLSSLNEVGGFKHKILVPGNHDYHIQNYAGLASSELRKNAGIYLLTDYRPTVELEGIKFLGIPFVTGLPGWAFNREEEWVYDWLCNVTEDFQPDVVISHAPIYGVLDLVPGTSDRSRDRRVGGLSTNRWFYEQEVKPKAWVCGHIHESYGHTNVEGTDFYNVAMCDRNYEQNNKPLTFEVS